MKSQQRQPLTASRPSLRLLGVAALGMTLLAPAAPVQASEVVKLARLVITGKRQPSRPPAPQPAAPDRNGEVSTQPQSRASDGELHAQTQRRTAEGALVLMD